jgi:outer membrane protein assembly factor BamC
LPLVSGSYVEEGYRGAKVFFDQVDEKQSLDTTIWNALLSFLEEQSIGVDYFDKEEQKLITDWIVTEYEIDSSWYSWSNTIQTVSQRFEMTLRRNLKPHGRSAALEVKLLEYKEIVESTESSNVSDIVKRTNEVDILNQVIGHYDQQLRVAQAKQIQKIRTGISTEMGFNADGQPAYLLAADFDIAWPRLLLVLRKMGFNVTDLDKSNGLLFVDYTGGETSWWGNLWGQEKAVLEEDEYRMQVDAIGKKVAVSISDKDNQPFTAKQVSALYDSFSSYMQSDDLDI